jgi:hypothetical protein
MIAGGEDAETTGDSPCRTGEGDSFRRVSFPVFISFFISISTSTRGRDEIDLSVARRRAKHGERTTVFD